MIRVLVVEDSSSVREFLIHVLDSAPGIQVIGTARNGREAVAAVREKKPDIVTMDIHMPEMDGFEATRTIMETQPVPIIIVSGSASAGEVAMNFKAIEAGALAVLARPRGMGHSDYETTVRELVQNVRLMSEVKVVRRWPQVKKEIPAPPPVDGLKKDISGIRAVAIGASTGGPLALQTILSGMPGNFPVPLMIVQHIASGFLEGFVHWLNQSSSLPLEIAAEGDCILPGHVYVAPEDYHMKVNDRDCITLSRAEPIDGLRPAVSFLFESVARVYRQNAIGVLLTGMGKDGALELKMMKENGAVTIAQDEASSIVHGMPGEAIRLNGATYILPPDKIAARLMSLVEQS